MENRMNKIALICGISGQDGAYLSKFLLSKNYTVIGTSRDAEANNFVNLNRLEVKSKIKLVSMNLNDFRSVFQVISKYEPDEIYNLSGQSSVGLSFSQPVETMESISAGVLNLLEVIRLINKKIKIYNAGSGESFGDTGNQRANEDSPFKPRSPYAIAKVASFWQVENYREAYNLFACSGLLFNHESPLRPARYVTQKIINGVKEIAKGNNSEIILGNLDIARDWGYAAEYVEPMWKMLQLDSPEDFIIATGKTSTLREFVHKAFEIFNLDWEKYVVIDKDLFRPLDIKSSRADPSKAMRKLNWKAQTSLDELVKVMFNSKI
jgi:GDPmannose 4,6-dehydratase